ncbi:KxYKxGKxW signal peptide domain-containing protein [Alcanivorax borkumensis]
MATNVTTNAINSATTTTTNTARVLHKSGKKLLFAGTSIATCALL